MLRYIGSLWFAGVLLVLLVVAMACATVFESAHGTEQALAAFYYSDWFEVLLALLGVNVLAALLLRFPFNKRQIGFVLTHASLLVTFGGALVTKQFGVDGRVGIIEGQSVDEFTLGRDTLTVASRGDQGKSSIDLTDTFRGRFEPADIPRAPLLRLGDLRVETLRYLPDSEWKRSVLNDARVPRPAIEVSLSPDGRADPSWVFVGQPAQVAGLHVSFRPVAERDELARLIDPPPTTQPTSKGTIRVTYAGDKYEFPVEEATDEAVPLGASGLTARVLRYLPHAVVGQDNQVVNASESALNPYVEVEIVGPEGSETHKAFARFPDFGSIHGSNPVPDLKLTFVAAASDSPTTPVEVLGGPDGELYVRFSRSVNDVATRALEVGEVVESPWPGRKFSVLRRYDRARVEWSLEPVEPVRKGRTPAVLLRLSSGANPAQAENAEELWLQKYRSRPVAVAGTTYDVTYADRDVPLGFSITLNSFQVGYYPGTRRPRSFESHITITEPATGRSLSRVISMNNPASFGGYTFYQSSYRQERGQTASFLSVARDPGKPIVFAGYIGTLVGMLWVLGTRVKESGRTAA